MNILQKRIQKKSQLEEIGGLLYSACLSQSRNPSFYLDLEVPDTIDGRFDMLVLHLFMVIYAMRSLNNDGQDISQSLFDMTFKDLERAIREMGIGDLSVPKHMKRMMEGFHGRCNAYKLAVLSGDDEQIRIAVARNIYANKLSECSSENVSHLVTYINDNLKNLSSLDLSEGKIEFMPLTIK